METEREMDEYTKWMLEKIETAKSRAFFEAFHRYRAFKSEQSSNVKIETPRLGVLEASTDAAANFIAKHHTAIQALEKRVGELEGAFGQEKLYDRMNAVERKLIDMEKPTPSPAWPKARIDANKLVREIEAALSIPSWPGGFGSSESWYLQMTRCIVGAVNEVLDQPPAPEEA